MVGDPTVSFLEKDIRSLESLKGHGKSLVYHLSSGQITIAFAMHPLPTAFITPCANHRWTLARSRHSPQVGWKYIQITSRELHDW